MKFFKINSKIKTCLDLLFRPKKEIDQTVSYDNNLFTQSHSTHNK